MTAVTPLPTWLASAAPEAATVEDIARLGYHSLIEAAVRAGVAPEGAQSMHALFDADILTHALGGFWRRLGVPLVGVTGSSEDYICAFEEQIGGRIDPIMRRLPLMDGAELGRLHVLGLAAMHKAGQTLVLREADQLLMRRAFDRDVVVDLTMQLESRGRSYWSEPVLELGAWGPFAGRPCWQAGTLARACYAALRFQDAEGGLTVLDVSALALLGATLRQVGMTRRCCACFRWAEPGTATCAEHASSEDRGEPEDSARSRKIARARELARQIYGEAHRADGPMHARCVGATTWLTRTLWRTAVDDEDAIVDTLMLRVASLPDLLEAMHTTPERLRRGPLLERLERHIDPLEVRPAAWLHAVELADAWHHWETWGRLPRSTGMTLRTRAKVRRAIESVRRGCRGRNEVAREIGVHPTLVSHWLQRGGGDDDVRRLSALLGAHRCVPHDEGTKTIEDERSPVLPEGRAGVVAGAGTEPVEVQEEEGPISEETRRRMLVLAKRVAETLSRLHAEGVIDPVDYRPLRWRAAGFPRQQEPEAPPSSANVAACPREGTRMPKLTIPSSTRSST